MKFICIFFVMLSHLGSNKIAPVLRAFYEPFFLNGFLFASGYTYHEGRPYKEFLKRKIKQLFVPWFLYSNLNIALSAIMSFNEKSLTPSQLFLRNMMQVRGYNDEIWFVAALFVAYQPFYWLVKKTKDKNWNPYIIPAICLFISKTYEWLMPKDILPWGSNSLPWHIEYIPQALAFMYLGYVVCKQKSEDLFKKAAILYPVLWTLPLLISQKGNLVLEAANEITGVMFLLTVSKMIKPTKWINFIGQNTLSYFALHRKLVTLWEVAWKKINRSLFEKIYANNMLSTVYSIAFSVFACMVLVIPIVLINKYLPELAGKERKK